MNDQQVGTNRVPGTLQLQVVATWQLWWIVQDAMNRASIFVQEMFGHNERRFARQTVVCRRAWLICRFCSFCFSGPINCYHSPASRAKLHGVMSENTRTKTACTQVSLEVSWNSWWVLACDVRYKSLCPKAPLKIAQQKTENKMTHFIVVKTSRLATFWHSTPIQKSLPSFEAWTVAQSWWIQACTNQINHDKSWLI